jgi:enamine deaminase RidA (YjgF/YER057c/UK114 family)
VGNQVFIAGQVSRDMEGRTLHPNDPAAQVREVWSNIEKALTSIGGTTRDIVRTTTYVVGADNLAEVRRARMEDMPADGLPTSTTLVVAGLAAPDLLVEVEVAAILGNNG